MKLLAIPFRQSGTQMYISIAPVKDLLPPRGQVDVWSQEDDRERGYQRAPESSRTGKIAQFLQSESKPLLPTSILLSYRGGHLNEHADDQEVVTLNLPDDATLWIVDGQHRVYGFDRAVKELGLDYLSDFILPVVIVEFDSIEDEANQFRIINETMKKVRTDLARRILALRAAGLGREGRRELRNSGRLWEAVAVEVLKVLSSDEESPWVGRIQSPNSRKTPHQVVRELSFTTSLKPILTEKPYRLWTSEQVANILIAYWRAWKSLVPEAFEDPQGYVMMKTPGVFSLHELAYYVLEVLRARGNNRPTENDFRDILKDLDEYATAEYWAKKNDRGAAMAGSMKGFSILADAMQEELELAGHVID